MLMEQKTLTSADIRQAINDLKDSKLSNDIARMSDESFIDCNFGEDLGLDSMDVVELTMNIEHNCNVNIPASATDSVILGQNTVKAMLETYNSHLG